ncbi:hypothetical protein FYC77_14535 [Natrialba swarupiae]|uniref:Uncharacterized protein n=1 Tax=Natrialba swarupiae TaxID=2448032 RepID=A0A5D5AHD3_9EURY|nr:hypothetical protein [Natrialba swarupiae]TYT61268.1 hypothetical protein FYC77_14535 [Natrialba swarupiae]
MTRSRILLTTSTSLWRTSPITIADASWSIGTAEPLEQPIVEATSSTAESTDTVHAVDEYLTVDALVSNAVVYAQLPEAWTTALDDS